MSPILTTHSLAIVVCRSPAIDEIVVDHPHVSDHLKQVVGVHRDLEIEGFPRGHDGWQELDGKREVDEGDGHDGHARGHEEPVLSPPVAPLVHKVLEKVLCRGQHGGVHRGGHCATDRDVDTSRSF
jgi:hypothetical protein